MTKRMTMMILCLIILFGGIFGYKFFQEKMASAYLSHFTPPPVTIAATTAKTADWNQYLTSVGTLKAIKGIEVSTEQAGTVEKILFESGQQVKKGDLLVQLDDSVEQAQLKSFKAQLNLARLNFKRDQSLFAQKAISRTQYDTSKATLEEAVASVEETQATIAKKAIRAPFSGKIGIAQVDPGQYISAGDSIAPLQDTQSLKLDFSLPEVDYPELYVGQPVQVEVQAYSDQKFSGVVSAINARVDTNTRNILVQASLPNKNQELVPGMFADAKIQRRQILSAIAVPVTAIDYSLYGSTVFTLKPTTKKDKQGQPVYEVKRASVKTGPEQDNDVAILSGLEAGQLVVTAGQLKLNNGAEAVINNDADQPDSDKN